MKETTRFFSITEINSLVKKLVEGSLTLRKVTVKGEISDFKAYTKAFYFSLKDDHSQLAAVMFFNFRMSIDYVPKDGDEVLALGSIKVYEKTGRYQLVVEDMIQFGFGVKLIRLQQLKAKLEREGLFSEARKRPLPKYPQAIGIIAGNDSAALKDIVTNIQRRFPISKLYFFPSLVQGKQAPEDILRALSLAYTYPLDVVIIGRGGGSEEDLSAFNDEMVVRHIATSPIPTIGAIGHEINTTLADLVCDKRASTPTGAAEMATRDKADINYEIGMLYKQLSDELVNRVTSLRTELDYLKGKSIFKDPKTIYDKRIQELELIKEKIKGSLQETLRRKGESLNRFTLRLINPLSTIKQYSIALSSITKRFHVSLINKYDNNVSLLSSYSNRLAALSPYAVLERGYSIITDESGKFVTDSNDVAEGDALTSILKHGKIVSIVKERKS